MLGVNLEKDTGPLSDEQVYGTSGSSPDAQPQLQVSEPEEQNAGQTAQAGKVAPVVIVKPKVTSTVSAPTVADRDIPSTGIPSSEQEALQAKLNAARARIGTSTSAGSSGNTGINSTVAGAKDRLAKVRAKLQDQ